MFATEINDALRTISGKVENGLRIGSEDALTLWEEAPLFLLGSLAFGVKHTKSGDRVFYNRNFHVEPTNVCAFKCRFCSFRRELGSDQAWDMTMEEVIHFVEQRAAPYITEVHIVGGVHPLHGLTYFAEMIRRIKAVIPQASVKAFTAIELAHMIEREGLDIRTGLQILKDAGMDTLPGGGAEIFDNEIRMSICPDKGPAEKWLAVHETAHQLGLPTNATMLYGHAENIFHRIDHLERLRTLQDKTGGFNAFIPLKYRSSGNEMSACGETSITEDLRMLALSRIYLDNFPHMKAYWPMYGRTTTELALSFGADDIDGTIEDSTRIYSMAGAEESKPTMTIEDLKNMAKAAGLTAVERDTFYNPR